VGGAAGVSMCVQRDHKTVWMTPVCNVPENNLGEEGAKALCSHLGKLQSITTLVLSSAFQ